MRAFTYTRPADPAAAVAAAADGSQATYLGGGTNLVDLMRLGVATPDALVDVNHLGLDGVEELPDGGLHIGAGVRNSDLAAHPAVRERYPVLARALLAGASGQLRNLATTGGNLLQRTRCLYFQDVAKPCNKREPGSGCSARTGNSRDLAILGASPSCLATHPSDMAVALAALDAVVHVLGSDGSRRIPLDELHRLPGEEPQRETILAPGELITAVEVPALAFGRRSTYRKVRDRASYAFAVSSVAAAIDVVDGTIRDVRLALGAVAPKPWRAHAAERELRGAPATAESFARAIEAELTAAEPTDDNAFKVPLTRRVVVRTLTELTEETA